MSTRNSNINNISHRLPNELATSESSLRITDKLLFDSISMHFNTGFQLMNSKNIKTIDKNYLLLFESQSNHRKKIDYRNIAANTEDYQLAINSFTEILKIDPEHLISIEMIGICKYAQKDFIGALQIFDRLIAYNSRYDFGYYQRGKLRHRLKDYAGAIEDFNNAISIDPNFVFVYLERAGVRISQDRFQDAHLDCKKALEILPNNILIYQRIGWIMVRTMDLNGIKDINLKVLEIDPTNEDALRHIAFAFSQLGDYHEAIEVWSKLIDLFGNSTFYESRAGVKLKLKDYAGALEDLNIAIEINSNIHSAYYTRAETKIIFNDYLAAIVDYTFAISIHSKFYKYFSKRASAKLFINDFEGAIEDYSQAIIRNPHNKKIYNYRGLAKMNLKDYSGAIQDIKKAIELDPNYKDAQINLERVYDLIDNSNNNN